MPLPDRFHWESTDDHARFFVEGRAVASVTRLDNGHARICFHTHCPRRSRYEFPSSMERGIARVEAWARKWEAELRADVREPQARPYI